MSAFTSKSANQTVTIAPADGALLRYLEDNGRMPPIALSIYPLENPREEIFIDKFISYQFQSSIITPVDSFNCEIYYEKINGQRKILEGDIMVLRANGIPIFTGIVDQVDCETDGLSGTRKTISGRDLLGQWEDQDSVSVDGQIIYANKYTFIQVIFALAKSTRVDPTKIISRRAPKTPYLFATQPGESKLSSLQRFCEGLDIFFWMSGSGQIIIGKPDMYGTREGRKSTLFLKRATRQANVLSMRSTRNATQIPNILLPIWNGQETVQDRVSREQIMKNASAGPARLYSLGHRTPRAIVVSTPEGSAPQDLSELNTIQKAGSSKILQAYAKREAAKANMKDQAVQVAVVGHYTDRAEPLIPDQMHRIIYDVDDIDEDMFLYEVDYTLNDKDGPRSRLMFCKQTALVADSRVLA